MTGICLGFAWDLAGIWLVDARSTCICHGEIEKREKLRGREERQTENVEAGCFRRRVAATSSAPSHNPPTLLQPRAFPPRTNARALRSITPQSTTYIHEPSATDHRRTDLAFAAVIGPDPPRPRKHTRQPPFIPRTLLGACNLTSPYLTSPAPIGPFSRAALLSHVPATTTAVRAPHPPPTTPSPDLYIPMPP
ncbi:hypothetical protein V500_06518 [Pseudogymnoascus sp. VKM F-4518 (FW-2643)]|nr:hypothetical protein V500_06518 [Pseudogymnoascus sp. VKM F-4518 (FW-2643)]